MAQPPFGPPFGPHRTPSVASHASGWRCGFVLVRSRKFARIGCASFCEICADLWIFIGGKEVYRACCEVAIALYRWPRLAQGVSGECRWNVRLWEFKVEYLFKWVSRTTRTLFTRIYKDRPPSPSRSISCRQPYLRRDTLDEHTLPWCTWKDSSSTNQA